LFKLHKIAPKKPGEDTSYGVKDLMELCLRKLLIFHFMSLSNTPILRYNNSTSRVAED